MNDTPKRAADRERIVARTARLKELGWKKKGVVWTNTNSIVRHSYESAVRLEQLRGNITSSHGQGVKSSSWKATGVRKKAKPQ